LSTAAAADRVQTNYQDDDGDDDEVVQVCSVVADELHCAVVCIGEFRSGGWQWCCDVHSEQKCVFSLTSRL